MRPKSPSGRLSWQVPALTSCAEERTICGAIGVKASHFARDLTEFLPLSPTPPESLVVREPYGRWNMRNVLWKVCVGEEAQDIAEYAVMLAVILVIVVGTIRLVGTNANNVFSSVASSVQ